MGWWSEDIMGGDTPLDFEANIYSICGAQMFYENNKILLSHLEISGNMPAIVEMIEREDDPIGWQVLAVLGMECGVIFSDAITEKMLQACDEDEWAQENDIRKTRINELKNAITNYTGELVVINSKGLFDTMFGNSTQPFVIPSFNPQTEEEIQKLNDFQHLGPFHPYTCDRGAVECEVNNIPRDYSKDGILIATTDGWICPCGKYKQPYRD